MIQSAAKKSGRFATSGHTWTSGFIVAVALLAVYVLFVPTKERIQSKLLPPDTPPAEYLYLDSARVSAYLGQIQGGIPE